MTKMTAAKIAKLLQSPDFGMGKDGGNGRAFVRKGKLVVQSPYYYASNRDLHAFAKAWEDGGTYGKFFIELYGVGFRVEPDPVTGEKHGARQVEDPRRFPGLNG